MKITEGFWRRLRFYLIGFTISTIFVIFLFGNRSCTWTPASRVKSVINGRILILPENQIEALNENGLNKSNIFNYLIQGKVDFSSSLKKMGEYPKVYVYEANDTLKNRLQVSLYEDSFVAFVHLLSPEEEPTQYKELSGWGEMVRFPRDSSLIYIDDADSVQCKAEHLFSKDEKEIVKNLKESGRINFSKSDLMLTKAEHQIEFFQNDTLKVTAKVIWFKDRITFKDFYWDFEVDCE